MVDGWLGPSYALSLLQRMFAQESFCDCLLKVSTFGIRDRGKEAPIRPRAKSILSLVPLCLPAILSSFHSIFKFGGVVRSVHLQHQLCSLFTSYFFFSASTLNTSKTPILKRFFCPLYTTLVTHSWQSFTTRYGAVRRRTGSFAPVPGVRSCSRVIFKHTY